MIKKHYTDVEEEQVTKANSQKTTIRWLITEKDGAEGFFTRRFEIEEGGQIGLHSHEEDHHFYVLEGTAVAIDQDLNEIPLKEGDVLYIPPNEPHGFTQTGENTFVFLCIIPNLKK